MENWLASVAILVALFTIPPVRAQALKGWWRAQAFYRRRIGPRERRASEISQWRAAPPKLLDRTVFRWFREDPQAWWQDVKGVYDRHKSPAIRQVAHELLWRKKRHDALQPGERLRSGGHVVEIVEQSPLYTTVRTSPDRTSTWRGDGMTEVTNGWCDRGADCPDCRGD